jgi:hypothetical protein
MNINGQADGTQPIYTDHNLEYMGRCFSIDGQTFSDYAQSDVLDSYEFDLRIYSFDLDNCTVDYDITMQNLASVGSSNELLADAEHPSRSILACPRDERTFPTTDQAFLNNLNETYRDLKNTINANSDETRNNVNKMY